MDWLIMIEQSAVSLVWLQPVTENFQEDADW